MTCYQLKRFPYILLATIIFICYSNTFNVPWHFDDQPNILENPAIHIDHLNFDSIKKTFFADPKFNERTYRPIAILSFAINWFFGKDNTFNYHITNLAIHIIVALLLFKIVNILFSYQSFGQHSSEEIYFVTLLGTTLWAIHPINTQAVTYIVQRMASMGAMFFLISLLNYLYARLIVDKICERFFYLFFFIVFFILSLGCKENAITLIPTIFLIEIFLYSRYNKFSHIFLFVSIILNSILIVVAIFFINSHGYFDNINQPFGNRPFSIADRLLTQPSVLLFYLSLLLIPTPYRFSIDHSFPLSTGFFSPWTTSPSIIILLSLILISFLCIKKYPLASFSFLFFFVNHIVESSIIPLEMVFEHRNYLPSMFLFIFFAGLVYKFLAFSSLHFRITYYTTIVIIPFILIFVGLGTLSRNHVWSSEETLWSDALKKAPTSARALAKLGIIYGWQKEKNEKNFRISLALLHRATESDFPNIKFKAAFYDNIGKLFGIYNFPEESINYYNKSLAIDDQFLIARIDLANTLQQLGHFESALTEINKILSTKNINRRFNNNKITILLQMGRFQEALEVSQRNLSHSNSNITDGYYLLGVSLSKSGHYLKARWFLRRALSSNPQDMRVLFSLLENSLLMGDSNGAKHYSMKLLTNYNLQNLLIFRNSLERDHFTAPIDFNLVIPFLKSTANSFF